MGEPHRLTDEDRRRGTETTRTKEKLTRKWYLAQLLAIAKGERPCSGPQLSALKAFAEQRGWYPPQSRKNIVSKQNLEKMLKKPPEVSPELAERLAQVQPIQ